jgi:hypothetical protein
LFFKAANVALRQTLHNILFFMKFKIPSTVARKNNMQNIAKDLKFHSKTVFLRYLDKMDEDDSKRIIYWKYINLIIIGNKLQCDTELSSLILIYPFISSYTFPNTEISLQCTIQNGLIY